MVQVQENSEMLMRSSSCCQVLIYPHSTPRYVSMCGSWLLNVAGEICFNPLRDASRLQLQLLYRIMTILLWPFTQCDQAQSSNAHLKLLLLSSSSSHELHFNCLVDNWKVSEPTMAKDISGQRSESHPIETLLRKANAAVQHHLYLLHRFRDVLLLDPQCQRQEQGG